MKNLDVTIETDLVPNDHRVQRNTQIRQMQKLVVMLTGILFVFAGSFPLAMWRVSQSEQPKLVAMIDFFTGGNILLILMP